MASTNICAFHSVYETDRSHSLKGITNKNVYRSDTVIYQTKKRKVYYYQAYGAIDQIYFNRSDIIKRSNDFQYNLIIDPFRLRGRRRNPYRPIRPFPPFFPGPGPVIPPVIPPIP